MLDIMVDTFPESVYEKKNDNCIVCIACIGYYSLVVSIEIDLVYIILLVKKIDEVKNLTKEEMIGTSSNSFLAYLFYNGCI